MKEVAGFSAYTLTRDGEVLSKFVKGGGGVKEDKLTPLTQVLDSNGYYIVSLISDEGKKVKRSVHRLLAQAFIPNPENKSQVNHIDGVKSNNSLGNLEWATPKENSIHAAMMGLTKERNLKFQRKVAQICLETGSVIAEYASLKEAEAVTGTRYPNISKVCSGVRKSAGGFSWKYLEASETIETTR